MAAPAPLASFLLVAFALLAVPAAGQTQGQRLQHTTLQDLSPLLARSGMGMASLLSPAHVTAEGRVQQNFTTVDKHGRVLHLHYDALVAPSHERTVIMLDHEPAATCVSCAAQQRVVLVLNASHADTPRLLTQLQSGSDRTYITGGLQAHVGSNCTRSTLLHRVVDVTVTKALAAATTVTVHAVVQDAAFSEVFKHATVHLYTNMSLHRKHPEDSPDFVVPEPVRHRRASDETASERVELDRASKETAAPESEELRSFGSFLSSVWSGVRSLGSDVVKIAEGIYDVGKAIVTGDYNYDHTWNIKSWDYNFNARAQAAVQKTVAIDSTVGCTNCFAHASVDLTFRLKIESYSLVELAVISDGQMLLNIEADMSFQARYQRSGSKHVTTIDAGTLDFMLGPVPVVIHTTVPVNISYHMDADVEGSVAVAASAQGSLSYGITYSASQGFNQIATSNFQHGGGLKSISLNMQASLQLSVLSTVVINVEYIGGPTVGIKPFVEFVASYGSGNACARYGGFQVAANWGLQITIGALVDIELGSETIYKHNFGSDTVYSIKRPLLSACVYASAEVTSSTPMVSALPGNHTSKGAVTRLVNEDSTPVKGALDTCSDGLLPGTTWTGYATRTSGSSKCAGYPDYKHITLQIIEADGVGDLTFVGSENYGTGDFACVLQATYLADYYSGNNAIILEPTSSGSVADYAYCTNANTKQPYGYSGQVDPTLTIINVTDSLNCLQLVLTRESPAGGVPQRCSGGPSPSPSPPPSPSPSPSPPSPSPPSPASGCCGSPTFGPCHVSSGGSCSFGCQCLSGNCGASLTCE